MSSNKVIYDWVSITSKIHSPQNFIDSLGLENVTWQSTKGAHGYRDRLYYDGISIHYNGRDDMGVWLEMSGQGCRAYETYSTACDYDYLFSEVKNNPDEMRITRLDVAFDDHDSILDIDRICADTLAGNYLSQSDFWEVTQSSKGQCIYFGSPTSQVRIRIYDKARERGLTDGSHWVRVELQLRDDRARAFVALPYDFGKNWCGVIIKYLRFVTPVPSDNNESRWPIADYWMDLLWFASALSIYEKPGVDYNIMRCENYVYNIAGNAVDALIQCYGVDEFIERLHSRKTQQNPKYIHLVDDYIKLKEEN